jgi:hypothetical protein
MISDAVKAEYFKRVFETIDGLWFMKVEEDSDFEHALEIDKRVWEIVPKIQARALKKLLALGDGAENLARALEAKFEMEDYSAEVLRAGGDLEIKVKKCPWNDLMHKSGREHLAGRVGEAICGTEYPVWLKEFKVDGEFKIEQLLCSDSDCCIMRFTIKNAFDRPPAA